MKNFSASFFNKLSYPQKFIIISVLFLLPLAVTIYLLVSELNTRIDYYGWREKYGIEYLRSLRQLMEHVQEHRELASVHLLEHSDHETKELPQLQAQINQDFEALALNDQQYGHILNTLERSRELKTGWDTIKVNFASWDAQENYQQHTALIADIRALISYVGDTSYLILDPELDSYYMMDTVLLRLPEAHDLISQLAVLGEPALTRKTLTPDERTQLINLTGLLKANTAAMKTNVQTAFKNNPSQNLKTELQTLLETELVDREHFIKLLETELIQAPVLSLDPEQFHVTALTSLQDSYNFYDAASPALERLIQARIDNLSTRRWSILVFAIGIALLAFVSGLVVMRSISQPLSKLIDAAEALGLGHLATRVEVTGADEVGRMGGAFNRMAQALQLSQERVMSQTQRLEIVSKLTEQLSAILKLEELLPEIVNQTQAKLNYYHAHIYLFDDKREKLVVAAGTGAAGAAMKAKGHSIPLNAPTSLVARAARSGEIVKVDNVREAPDWLPNPLLPDTYSEMAVPIHLSGQIVGVLDVQENKIAGLDEGDINLLRTLANQIAIAIRNASQFAEVEAALTEARESQRRYIVEGWDKSRITQKNLGRVQYSLDTSTALEENVIATARQHAVSHSEPTIITLNGDQQDHDETTQALVAPITLRNVPIGDLQLHDVPDREWSEAELALINAVVDQVAQAAENLRLVSETQAQASREQLINQVNEKLRRAPDMETLLQTGVSELARILGPARAFAHLNMNVGQTAQNGNNIKDGLESLTAPITVE